MGLLSFERAFGKADKLRSPMHLVAEKRKSRREKRLFLLPGRRKTSEVYGLPEEQGVT